MSEAHHLIDLWSIPCAVPPLGVTSDFHRTSPLKAITIGIIVTVFCLMTAALSLRFWMKYRSHEAWQLDDTFTLATYILTLAHGTMQFPIVAKLGFEAWDVPLGMLLTDWTREMLAANTCIAQVMLFFGKCCVLAFYFRIFNHMKNLRIQIYATAFLASSLVIAAIVMPFWIGPPKLLSWFRLLEKKDSLPKASKAASLTLAVGIIKLVVDLLIVYIPIPVVVRMKLSRRKKTGVLATFLTGSIAIIADIVDLYFRIHLFGGESKPFIYGIYITLCSVTEAGISVIVASMPVAGKVWQRHVVGSALYNFVRSRFSSMKTSSAQDTPSDLQLAKANVQKRRRGQYSIATFLTSLSRWADGTEHATSNHTELTIVREFRQSLDQRFADGNGFSTQLNGPSEFGSNSGDV